jgi:pyruvate dehydrogenase E1 component
MLEHDYGVAADLWSVTSYKQLFVDAVETTRWNMLHPAEKPRIPYVSRCLEDAPDGVVATSDYSRLLPYSVAQWISVPFLALGTDGFGRSECRTALRDFFEVDARHMTLAVLGTLSKNGKISSDVVSRAMKTMDVDPDKANPMRS